MRGLRIAMLSWEYPPVVVGGLARHVHALSGALASLGHEVTVYTRGHPDSPTEEDDRGVRVVRADEYPPRIAFEDLVPWVLALNLSLLHRAQADPGEIDVLHAHDWLVAHAAAALKDLHRLPLVATVHATEFGRRGSTGKGLKGRPSAFIHQVERWLTSEAGRIITCSDYMRRQVNDLFHLPPDTVDVIPNGVDLEMFAAPPVERDTGERVVLFAGRLEFEKGVQTVLDALPRVRERVGRIRFEVAGAGTHRAELERQAAKLAVRVRFLGFLDEVALRERYAAADLVIVPSLYEPFGLVTLETMAAGTPVAVADTGGLQETVAHGETGLRFTPGDPAACAEAITRLLTDRRLARKLAMRAREVLASRYSWAAAADRTVEVYRRAIREDVRRRERAPLRAVFDREFGGG